MINLNKMKKIFYCGKMFDKIVLLRIIKCKVYTLLWNILFAD